MPEIAFSARRNDVIAVSSPIVEGRVPTNSLFPKTSIFSDSDSVSRIEENVENQATNTFIPRLVSSENSSAQSPSSPPLLYPSDNRRHIGSISDVHEMFTCR